MALWRFVPTVRRAAVTRPTSPRYPLPRYLPDSHYTTQAESVKPPLRPCPKCSSPLPLPVSPCPKCSTLLELPHDLSFHSLLNISQPLPANAAFSSAFDIPLELSQLPSHGFDLDPRDLRQRMLTRQKELHPDKFTAKGVNEVALARELSGRVNDAFSVLADPLTRAEYIVSRGYSFPAW